MAILRAPYSSLVNQVDTYTEQHRLAQESLDNASASQDITRNSSLITPVGKVEVGDSPIGPGRMTIAAASWAAGFMLGAGLVFLSRRSPSWKKRAASLLAGAAPINPEPQPVQFGRRASDQTAKTDDKDEATQLEYSDASLSRLIGQ